MFGNKVVTRSLSPTSRHILSSRENSLALSMIAANKNPFFQFELRKRFGSHFIGFLDMELHFIRGRVNAQYSDLQAMHHLANGQIETLQFHIKEANKMTAKPLSQLKLKKGILIAAIIEKARLFSQQERICWKLETSS